MSLNAPGSAPNAIPPGWYADPTGPGSARWWSGQDWTHHVQALPSIPQVAPPNARMRMLARPSRRSLVRTILICAAGAVLVAVALLAAILMLGR